MSEEKREKIIAAAKKAFAKKGFSAVGIREIARHAGINSATLYHYFKNKEKLYAVVLDRTFEEIFSIMGEFARMPRTDVFDGKLIRDMIYRYMEFLNDNRDFLKIMIHELNLDSDRVSKISKKYLKDFFSQTEEFISEQQELAGEIVRQKSAKHYLISSIGLSISYFLLAPILEAIEGEDQFTREKLDERKEAIADLMLYGTIAD
ncbi:MAG: TetR/AcrR family transcriptional regulator [Deltaproteobacteria bacterium]|nr:TetR/AcrR family transcriptional regulator [Candidatus Zymogenaceae bacterium]